ncbi:MULTISPECIES: polysaccharide biosynthesis/export family protein [unclassified Shewanella]|uniref:polysaccharide biosynthesis/export family protein n=1 Tax=unclassified Shewanella TaxID=196818 RepID=UPI000C81FDD2|nr:MULTISPECIES: polysaccharide biosynthesis/export family protein [unclassified Shewanella]MDO6619799.1 polysaccharide biosynthesis/export family protein [Shewanella sp. 6_MG-2023]MDO6638964.1 polysaccharide biosynthesis/export family protein [Shewanella sp. 5_MG-2023]MDO6676987.1 polysaccharide biosynthesis/export family protein [Shewanella sp. 4_MG-2023]MDO6774038.1 polysaccharide biosynthesis/export family protein [Shewanella sp. 3_MG-2023]PMG27601.1 capsular biosynthesis protein [Shewanel
MRFLFLSLVLALVSMMLTSTAEAVESDDSYLLGAGDTIIIQVYGEDALTLETQLTNSGTINFPFLGPIKLNGLTIKQVEQIVYKGLKGDYFVEPSVYVGMVEYRPFYIHGEVKKPGGYPYQPGMTVNQAIALAGGLTERASEDKINISREGAKVNSKRGNINSKIFAGDTITIEQRFF